MDYVLFQDVVNSHPGLAFLKEAPDFHSRYITTVRHLGTARLHCACNVMSSMRENSAGFMEFFSDHTDNCFQVIQRIFYNVNRSWSGKITCSELRKSNFLQVYCKLCISIYFLCVVLQKNNKLTEVKLTGNILGAPPQPFYFLGL